MILWVNPVYLPSSPLIIVDLTAIDRYSGLNLGFGELWNAFHNCSIAPQTHIWRLEKPGAERAAKLMLVLCRQMLSRWHPFMHTEAEAISLAPGFSRFPSRAGKK